jgi:parallel beta-helix repeat protein
MPSANAYHPSWSCLGLLLVCGLPACATTYYVANAGSDSNAGTTSNAPWQTIARVNATSFSPGDSILFKRGDVWREQLLPASSGSPTRQITFSAYGEGVNPVVSGADLVTHWTKESGSVWSASLPNQPNVVFLSGTLGIQQPSPTQLSAAGQWSWSQATLYVYEASGTPTKVEAAQRPYALLLGQTGSGSYTTISGIDFHIANEDLVHIVNTTGDILNGGAITGAYQFGVFAIGVNGTTVDHLQITNNTVSWNGSSGIEISFGHNHVLVQGNKVFSNAFNPVNTGNFQFMAGIYLFSTSGLPTNDLVQNNTSSNNGVAGGTESQGSGIWLDTLSNSTVQNNITFGNVAHGIFLEKNTNSQMLNNISYSNASAPNSANLTCYASFGVPATGNIVAHNVSTDSHNIGLKVGAYQGGGLTMFSNNTFEYNEIKNSQSVDIYIDSGANNDGVPGSGNRFASNTYVTSNQ